MAKWYAVKTRAKFERKALEDLQDAGLEAYLPEYRIERFNRRRRVTIVSTLCHFPRYLFVLAEEGQFAAIRACDGVSDVLPGFPMAPIPVPTKDVVELRAAQADMAFDDTDEARRHRGQTVRNTLEAMRKRLRNKRVLINDGPFLGFRGKVEAVHSLDRLQVAISIMGRETLVELESMQVEGLAA